MERLGAGAMSEEAVREIKRTLNGRASLLVAVAAQIAAKRGLIDLAPDLIAAFEKFMVNGAGTDKQCNAKGAIADALNKMEYPGAEAFLAGASYVQMEPAYGGPVDTAVEVRCSCAYGLARIGHPDALYVLADMLVDAERAVRVASAKAITYLGTLEGELLLRLKALTGDVELDVTGECFTGLLTMTAERSLGFVARFLSSHDAAVAERAALAVGESQASRAFEVLREQWDNDVSPARRRVLLLPIALVRSDAAFEFLIEVARTGDRLTAAQAVSALGLYSDDRSLAIVREVLALRSDLHSTRR